MRNWNDSNYTGEYGDYMEAYDEDAFEVDYDESDIEALEEEASTDTTMDITPEEDDELIDAYYEFFGIVRRKFDDNGEPLMYDDNSENLQVIFTAYRDGDDETKSIAACLIEHRLRNLVPSIAHKYYSTYMASKQEANDLLNCGWEGVFKVAGSYDPTRSSPSTFFYRHILHEMDEHVKRFVHKSTGYSIRVYKKIRDASDALVARGIRNPSVMDLAYETGLRTSVIRNALGCQTCRESRSFDDMAFDPEAYSKDGKSAKAREDYDMLCKNTPGEFSNPLAIICDKEDSCIIIRAINTLTFLQKEVICRLFGIGRPRQTYTEIFQDMKIPTDQLKIIEAQAKKALSQNSDLCRAFNGGYAVDTKRELDFEPIAFTPDKVGVAMMDALSDLEDIGF